MAAKRTSDTSRGEGDSEKANANGNKSFSDNISKLVDEKRKHLERRLSASQRDELLLKEAKEDRLERKELRDMLKLSGLGDIQGLSS